MAQPPKLDCRHYLGDRPCGRREPCDDACPEYAPMGARILVIKLAAAGDVLRSTAVLPGLRETYGPAHITWVTERPAMPLLEGHPEIDRLLEFGFDTWLLLSRQTFDVAVCLDKDPKAAALLESIEAGRKLGFGLSSWGTVRALNEGAAYDLELGLSNRKKFHENRLTYPEIVCGVADVPYARRPYVMTLSEGAAREAERFLSRLQITDPLVGMNVGAGPVFARKAWTPEGYAALAKLVRGRLGGSALVLGGPDDRPAMEEVLRLADGSALDGGLHSLDVFAAVVAQLDALVTGDTMALHIGVALGVPAVAIFGPTVPQEIDLFDRGAMVVADVPCAPCYRRACDVTPGCMDAIGPEAVFEALASVLREDT